MQMHTYIPSFTTSKQLLQLSKRKSQIHTKRGSQLKGYKKNYELSHIIQICELKVSPTTIGFEIAHM
jgi:hypothetical protein